MKIRFLSLLALLVACLCDAQVIQHTPIYNGRLQGNSLDGNTFGATNFGTVQASNFTGGTFTGVGSNLTGVILSSNGKGTNNYFTNATASALTATNLISNDSTNLLQLDANQRILFSSDGGNPFTSVDWQNQLLGSEPAMPHPGINLDWQNQKLSGSWAINNLTATNNVSAASFIGGTFTGNGGGLTNIQQANALISNSVATNLEMIGGSNYNNIYYQNSTLPYVGYETFYGGYNGQTNVHSSGQTNIYCNSSEFVVLLYATNLINDGMLAYANGQFLMGIDTWIGGRSNGVLFADTNRFPDGMSNVIKTLHGMGLKVQLYDELEDDAYTSLPCSGGASSPSHAAQDAATFASWGVDAVAVDILGQSLPDEQIHQRHVIFQNAFKSTGRPIYYTGYFSPATYTNGFQPWMTEANSWRSCYETGSFSTNQWTDICSRWDYLFASSANMSKSHRPEAIVLGASGMTSYNGYQGWLTLGIVAMFQTDMIFAQDPIGYGNGWNVYGTNINIRRIQCDSLFTPPFLVATNGANTQAWEKPLSDGSSALFIFNRSNLSETISFPIQQIGVASNASANLADCFFFTNYTASGTITIQSPANTCSLWIVQPQTGLNNMNGSGFGSPPVLDIVNNGAGNIDQLLFLDAANGDSSIQAQWRWGKNVYWYWQNSKTQWALYDSSFNPVETFDQSGNVAFTGTISGNGASLTSLPASQLTGTVPFSAYPQTGIGTNGNVLTTSGSSVSWVAPSGGGTVNSNAFVSATNGNGGTITNLNASNLASGTVPISVMPTNIIVNTTNAMIVSNVNITGQANVINNLAAGTVTISNSFTSDNSAIGSDGSGDLGVRSLAALGASSDFTAIEVLPAGTIVFDTGTTRIGIGITNTGAGFIGNGNGLTNLNAANLTGTQANGTESTNDVLRNGNNLLTGTNTFTNTVIILVSTNGTNTIGPYGFTNVTASGSIIMPSNNIMTIQGSSVAKIGTATTGVSAYYSGNASLSTANNAIAVANNANNTFTGTNIFNGLMTNNALFPATNGFYGTVGTAWTNGARRGVATIYFSYSTGVGSGANALLTHTNSDSTVQSFPWSIGGLTGLSEAGTNSLECQIGSNSVVNLTGTSITVTGSTISWQ